VEDKGAEVGLFVIGHDKRLHVPAADSRFIPAATRPGAWRSNPWAWNFC
jgi:hypothetical protein